MEHLILITKDILVMLDLLQFGFSRFDERGLVVDDVFQTADEPPHLFGCDSARAFRRREGIAASRSLPAIGERIERTDCHSGLEIFNREAGHRFLGVCGRGLGSPCGWVRHRSGVSSRSVHRVILYRNNLDHNVVRPPVLSIRTVIRGYSKFRLPVQ